MFGAVMLDSDNCKGILERSLGIAIERVEVSREKSIVYNRECKGVRLDIYAKDEHNTHMLFLFAISTRLGKGNIDIQEKKLVKKHQSF